MSVWMKPYHLPFRFVSSHNEPRGFNPWPIVSSTCESSLNGFCLTNDKIRWTLASTRCLVDSRVGGTFLCYLNLLPRGKILCSIFPSKPLVTSDLILIFLKFHKLFLYNYSQWIKIILNYSLYYYLLFVICYFRLF